VLYCRTWTGIYDPVDGSVSNTPIRGTDHDMFCPGTAVLANGKIMIMGGSTQTRVSIYDPSDGPSEFDKWSRGEEMHIARGYQSATVLSDGSVFTVGGSWNIDLVYTGHKDAEVWNATQNKWIEKFGIQGDDLATDDNQDYHAWLFQADNGRIFHAGPSRWMHWIDLGGVDEEGSFEKAGLREDPNFPGGDEAVDQMSGNAAMFEAGKILIVGGAPKYDMGTPATAKTYIVDINGDEPVVTRSGDMSVPRTFSNLVVLPTGEVMVIGGMPAAHQFSDKDSHFHCEIWNPDTGKWRIESSILVPRNYHSTAILTKDGRIFAGGGGLCGPNCGDANHLDAQIFSPSYLFDSNRQSGMALRPRLLTYPSIIEPDEVIEVKTSDYEQGQEFVLIRLSAVTHSTNNDQRRLVLEKWRQRGKDFKLKMPNKNVLLPGTYFMYVIDRFGTPSVGYTVVYDLGNHDL